MFDSSKWELKKQDDNSVRELSKALGISAICARLLVNRGFSSPTEAKAFLDNSDSFLFDPYLMKDMDRAVDRIKAALENEEKITIYGDYDVDGVTSVSILYMYLRDHGADIDYYIPTRESEGYGLNTAAFDAIRAGGTKLIITVDTGITAIDEVKYALGIGLDIVVTDHHQCRAELPDAYAVVNPRRADCTYPFKELSGVGVVFKILCALELDMINGRSYNIFTIKDMCKRYIDLVTIGTVADVMPLVGENRVIVSLGLSFLSHTRQLGICALFKAAGIELGGARKITSSTIGFAVAPRINAAGRIGSAARAVQLFLADSPALADVIAEELCATNRERQTTENDIYCEAIEQLEKSHDLSREHVIVLASDTWHHGIVGIVASRLTERFNLPSVLISFDGADDEGSVGKGSARSVKGLNLVKALEYCEDLLCKYGGHELAAGLTIERGKLDEFRKKLDGYVRDNLDIAASETKLPVETEVCAEEVCEETINSISLAEPFGAGNPIPLFLIRNCLITSLIPLSLGKHTKLTLESHGEIINAVCFGSNLQKEGFAVGDEVDTVFSMDINDFRGTRSVQAVIKDIDFSDTLKTKLSLSQKEADMIISGEKIPSGGDIPSREECSAVYTALKSLIPSGKGTVSLKKIISSPCAPSIEKTAVAFTAFIQKNLISAEKISEFDYRVEFHKPSEKVNLMTAPVMTKRTGGI